MKTHFKKIFQLKSNIFWAITAFSAVVGLISIWSLNIYNGGKSHLNRDPAWMEFVILPFYFTTLSALISLIYSILYIFKLVKNEVIERKLAIFTLANLILTFIIYWSVVFPAGNSKGIGWLHNIVLHIVVPFFSAIASTYRVIENKSKEKTQINIWLSPLWNIAFMLIWFTIALVIYYVSGAKTGNAMYKFLDFKNAKSLMMPIIIICGSSILYYLSSVGLTKISNITKNANITKNTKNTNKKIKNI